MEYKNKKAISFLKRPTLLPYLAGAVVFITIFMISEWLVHMDEQIHDDQYYARVNGKLDHFSHQLQKAIDSNLLIMEAMESLLLLNSDISETDFELLASRFLSTRPSIQQAQLSPNAVVKFIYPNQHKQTLIGLDLRSISSQRKTIEHSIQSQTMIMAGPVKLIQGGIGLIARKPLFIETNEKPAFWGFLTLIIDTDALFDEAGVVPKDNLTQFSVRGTNAEGEDGGIFFGVHKVFNNDFVSTLIDVPGGEWEMAASIDKNHQLHEKSHSLLSIWGLLASSAFGLLTGFCCLLWINTYLRSIHDPLTKLLDRQYFQKRAQAEIDRAKRHNHPLSLVMIDLDLFKEINDNYGHQIGDSILSRSAELIKESLNEGEEAGRYGGEEFIVIIPNSDAEQAVQHAENIRMKIARDILIQGLTINISASFGVASLSRETSSYDELVFHADKALYQAKAKGRNCVVSAESKSPPL